MTVTTNDSDIKAKNREKIDQFVNIRIKNNWDILNILQNVILWDTFSRIIQWFTIFFQCEIYWYV